MSASAKMRDAISVIVERLDTDGQGISRKELREAMIEDIPEIICKEDGGVKEYILHNIIQNSGKNNIKNVRVGKSKGKIMFYYAEGNGNQVGIFDKGDGEDGESKLSIFFAEYDRFKTEVNKRELLTLDFMTVSEEELKNIDVYREITQLMKTMDNEFGRLQENIDK